MHAFICAGATLGCNNLNALTTYYFANANDSTKGGNRFTTDNTGAGPGDTANWAGSSYFGASYAWWTNRGDGTNTLWALTYNGYDYAISGDWNTGTNAQSGTVANTNNTGNGRWNWNTNPTCDNTENLICYVNP